MFELETLSKRTKIIDVFLDNIFTDIKVLDKLIMNESLLNDMLDSLKIVHRKTKVIKSNMKNEQSILQQQLDDLLLSSS